VPVLRPTEPWESLLAYTSVQRVGGTLMMWYAHVHEGCVVILRWHLLPFRRDSRKIPIQT
jgi:hypothetical protein